MIRATIPDTVHAVSDGDGRLVLLNATTGRWFVLNRTGSLFYERLRELADIEEATDALIARHPAVPIQRIRGDVDELVEALVRRGLIELTDDGREAAGVLMALPGADPPVPVGYRLAAMVAFPLAILLLRLPFRVTTALVTRLNRARPEASRQTARTALIAARWAGRHYPGRVACLELSLTAVLIAALAGGRVDWCLGFAVDPYAFHAWIEVAGEPVAHPFDEPIPPTYRRVLRT